MAFALNALYSAAHAGNGNKIWHYKSADSHATIVGANYFDGGAHLLQVGDVIHAVSSAAVNGATGGGIKTYYVSVISNAGVVTVVAALAA